MLGSGIGKGLEDLALEELVFGMELESGLSKSEGFSLGMELELELDLLTSGIGEDVGSGVGRNGAAVERKVLDGSLPGNCAG